MNLLRNLILAAGVAALSLGAVACGDVCADAADLCATGDGDGDGDGAEAECTGAAETISQCIVDAGNCDTETLVDCATPAE